MALGLRIAGAALAAYLGALAPAQAMTCEELNYGEAVAYTNGLPRAKWFRPDAASAEENARVWMKSPKGRAQLERDRQRKRRGCT